MCRLVWWRKHRGVLQVVYYPAVNVRVWWLRFSLFQVTAVLCSVLWFLRREECVLDSQGHCKCDESCSKSTQHHFTEADRWAEAVPPRFVPENNTALGVRVLVETKQLLIVHKPKCKFSVATERENHASTGGDLSIQWLILLLKSIKNSYRKTKLTCL